MLLDIPKGKVYLLESSKCMMNLWTGRSGNEMVKEMVLALMCSSTEHCHHQEQSNMFQTYILTSENQSMVTNIGFCWFECRLVGTESSLGLHHQPIYILSLQVMWNSMIPSIAEISTKFPASPFLVFHISHIVLGIECS